MTEPSTTPKQMRFLALDSWRGIAALFVALYHLNAYGHFYGLPIVRNSFLFVDFFFVLSGFIISYSYCDRLTRLSAVVSFMIKRFGRVWPLHAVMLAVFVAFPILEWSGCYFTKLCGTDWPFNPEHDNLGTFFSNLLLVHSLGLHDSLTWNWPSWSISTEFWTYALFALVAATLRASLVPVALWLVVACTLLLMLLAPGHMDVTYDFGYFRCVRGFFIGFLTFRLYAFRQMALAQILPRLKSSHSHPRVRIPVACRHIECRDGGASNIRPMRLRVRPRGGSNLGDTKDNALSENRRMVLLNLHGACVHPDCGTEG